MAGFYRLWSGSNGSRCSSYAGALRRSFASDGRLVVTSAAAGSLPVWHATALRTASSDAALRAATWVRPHVAVLGVPATGGPRRLTVHRPHAARRFALRHFVAPCRVVEEQPCLRVLTDACRPTGF
ncbi:predicted protein [Streptomyces viridochromogenes DSM 40736]|uniref:Predicted protein n=1 Tax=Streptomyces viridochromogenes (strain DSM 40736 / JCM 4977 / BCRC 1201 / Tue 494) TaxID=591159 RepID=D9X1B3_STRVT|nr:predicted protein [Streptomyces viridochromogenes DSM 40736]